MLPLQYLSSAFFSLHSSGEKLGANTACCAGVGLESHGTLGLWDVEVLQLRAVYEKELFRELRGK